LWVKSFLLLRERSEKLSEKCKRKKCIITHVSMQQGSRDSMLNAGIGAASDAGVALFSQAKRNVENFGAKGNDRF
jgi:hypothetical protein